MSNSDYQTTPYGPLAVLLDFAGTQRGSKAVGPAVAAAVASQLRRLPRVVEAVPAYSEVLVSYRHPGDLAAVLATVDGARRRWLGKRREAIGGEGAVHDVGVQYDGPDLAYVSAMTGLRAEEVVALHASRAYTVQAVGFQPGFAYLGTLPPELRLLRRRQPRARVPAGAVAIATDQTAIYPHVSPGGWHLIGSVVDPPMALDVLSGGGPSVGDIVRFNALGR